MRTFLLLPVAWASIAWAIPVPHKDLIKVLTKRDPSCPERLGAYALCALQDQQKWTPIAFDICARVYDAGRTCKAPEGPAPPPSIAMAPGTVITVSQAGEVTTNGQASSSANTARTDKKGDTGSNKKKEDSSKDGKVPSVQVDTVETPTTPTSSRDGTVPSVQVDTESSSSDRSRSDTSSQPSFDQLASALGSQSRYTDLTYSRNAEIDPAVLDQYERYYGRGGTDYTLGQGRSLYGGNYGADPSTDATNEWLARAGQRGAQRMDTAPKSNAYVISGKAGTGAIEGKGWIASGQPPQ